MKSNIFYFNKFKHQEDYFTNSLVYILNLFSEDLGDRFLNKIESLSGVDKGYFGKFEKVEFVGYELQNEKSKSKPDMIITTSKIKIYFENKIDAPLSKKQLERHMEDVKKDKDPSKLIFISNRQLRISDDILKDKDYIKPKDQEHFIWADFENVFKIKFRKGSTEQKLLDDFKESLRSNGMRGRQIIGADDNLYTNGSKAQTLILEKLNNILKKEEIGFKSFRRKKESTLIVNRHKYGKFPLFNPRFLATGEGIFDDWNQECLVIYCYTDLGKTNPKLAKIDLENVFKTLKLKFKEIEILNLGEESNNRGYIYIPLKWKHIKNNKHDLDWKYLEEIWKEIYNAIK